MKKYNYLTLGGLFISLHLLFVLMSKILAGSELILVIFLPLLSTIYALKFGFKEVVIFDISTFLLCAIFEPISTFIYVLPALICGTLYGELRKSKMKELSLVYISGLSHSFSFLIAFLFISIMFKEVDFFNIFSSFIHKEGDEFYLSIYMILILYGLIEAFLVHIITNNELKKLGYRELESEKSTPFWMEIGLLISIGTYFILYLINPIYSLYIMPFLIAFIIPNIIDSISLNKYKWKYFLMGIILLIVIFILPYINKIIMPLVLLIVFLPLIIENFIRVLYTFLLKYSNNEKNNIE